MKRDGRDRGAITVFLSLILVPCMLVSSIFVDIGRVSLSRASVNASAELALNSLMTNYDADLNEWYGLVTSCQNIEEFYDISAQYFARCIKSKGLTDSELEILSNYYADVTDDDSIYDYLRVDVTDDAKISAVKGTDLTNATILKSEIVDFMKYRAPVTIITDIIERLKSTPGLDKIAPADEGEASMAEKEQPMVDAKTAFYQAEANFNKAAYHTYKYMFDNYTKKNLGNDYLEKVIEGLDTGVKLYKEAHSAMVHDLYNASGVQEFVRFTVKKDFETYDKTKSGCYSRKEGTGDSAVYYLDGTLFNNLYDATCKARDSFKNAKDEFCKAIEYKKSSDYSNQYWIQSYRKLYGLDGGTNYYKNFSDAATSMMRAKLKLEAAYTCEKGTGLPTDFETKYTEITEEIMKSWYNPYLDPDFANFNTSNDEYIKKVRELQNVSKGKYAEIDPTQHKLSNDKSVSQNIRDIFSGTLTNRGRIVKLRDALKIVVKGDADLGITSLAELYNLAVEYQVAFENWKKAVDEAPDESEEKEIDLKEISDLENGITKDGHTQPAIKVENISAEAIDEMSERLQNAETQLDTVVVYIDSVVYANKWIYEIHDYDTLRNLAANSGYITDIPLDKTQLDQISNSSLNELFKYSDKIKDKKVPFEDDAYNILIDPDTHRGKPNCFNAKSNISASMYPNVNVPELYCNLYSKFYGIDDSKVDEAEQDEKDIEDRKASAEEDEKNKGSQLNAKDIPQSIKSESEGFGLGKAILSIGSIIYKIISGDIDSVRDDLYVAVYALKMFSFDTYESENKYTILKNELNTDMKGLSGKTIQSKYETDEVKNYLDTNETKEHHWYNSSLTNKVICSDNNYGYGAELEYILYGKSTSKENVDAMYTELFAIRMALNSISGFINFYPPEKNTTAMLISTIAMSVSAATMGIVPEPAVKIILIALLITLETVKDIDRLRTGCPVEIYKQNANDWQYSVSGDFKSMSKFSEALNLSDFTNKDEGLFYSDYLTIFLVSGFQKGGLKDDMTIRLAEVIQANMQKQIVKDDSWEMKNARNYFEINAELRVSPLLLTIPLYSEWVSDSSLGQDWCTYNISVTRGY